MRKKVLVSLVLILSILTLSALRSDLLLYKNGLKTLLIDKYKISGYDLSETIYRERYFRYRLNQSLYIGNWSWIDTSLSLDENFNERYLLETYSLDIKIDPKTIESAIAELQYFAPKSTLVQINNSLHTIDGLDKNRLKTLLISCSFDVANENSFFSKLDIFNLFSYNTTKKILKSDFESFIFRLVSENTNNYIIVPLKNFYGKIDKELWFKNTMFSFRINRAENYMNPEIRYKLDSYREYFSENRQYKFADYYKLKDLAESGYPDLALLIMVFNIDNVYLRTADKEDLTQYFSDMSSYLKTVKEEAAAEKLILMLPVND